MPRQRDGHRKVRGNLRHVRRLRPRGRAGGRSTPERKGPTSSGGIDVGQWREQDSNLRRQSQRVYSPSPLTTRTSLRARSQSLARVRERRRPVDEPPKDQVRSRRRCALRSAARPLRTSRTPTTRNGSMTRTAIIPIVSPSNVHAKTTMSSGPKTAHARSTYENCARRPDTGGTVPVTDRRASTSCGAARATRRRAAAGSAGAAGGGAATGPRSDARAHG